MVEGEPYPLLLDEMAAWKNCVLFLLKVFEFFSKKRQLTEEGPAFGKVTTGDLRVAELGSWLQPTKGDYYLQRLSVLLRKRMTAK